MKRDDSITIVIPVYADWPSLSDCIDSLYKYVDFSTHKLLLVNDNGPEADFIETNILSNIAGHKNVEYFRNPKNLGFVQTCNRAALELDETNNHILLLNSDTKVTEGFLEECLNVLNSSNKIGAVTPRTNNATLATIPLRTAKEKGIDPQESYKIFLAIKNKLPKYSEVPTAHGYCMLIRRSLIKKYGLFDEVFGKGYGEENDFCMRIKYHGYKSVLANRAYVFHLEARSFTPESKAKILEKNLKIMYERWPNYRQLVREYMEKAVMFESEVEQVKTTKTNRSHQWHPKRLIQKNPTIYRHSKKIQRKLKRKN